MGIQQGYQAVQGARMPPQDSAGRGDGCRKGIQSVWFQITRSDEDGWEEMWQDNGGVQEIAGSSGQLGCPRALSGQGRQVGPFCIFVVVLVQLVFQQSFW